MSVKKEASGRRSIQVEVEVPGTPEEVWQAIATGPGISAWFVPAEFEERDGKPVAGDVELRPGHGVPFRGDGLGSAPDVRQGGRRLVPGLAADRDRVDRRGAGGRRLRRTRGAKPLRQHGRLGQNKLIGSESGWPGFFRILRLYLAHFPGRRSAMMQFLAPRRGNGRGGLGEADRNSGAGRRGRRARLGRPVGRPGAGRRGGEHQPESTTRRPAPARQAGARHRRPVYHEVRRGGHGGPQFSTTTAISRPRPSPAKRRRGRPWLQEHFPDAPGAEPGRMTARVRERIRASVHQAGASSGRPPRGEPPPTSGMSAPTPPSESPKQINAII